MRNKKEFSGTTSVKELFAMNGLTIPNYQRPYKWTAKNVAQLLDDIEHYSKRYKKNEKDKDFRYRLGTIVFHESENQLNIVDGQQRTVTFLLIAKALGEIDEKNQEVLKNLGIAENLKKLERSLEFTSKISANNIIQNYFYIKKQLKRDGDGEHLLRFIFEQCEFVYFRLDNLSEAFQFFDSQNSRGKGLNPHNLLKAYHLREFSSGEENKEDIVAKWESINPQDLKDLFGKFLFPIKTWMFDSSVKAFTKNEVDVFKGVDLNGQDDFPFLQLFKLAEEHGEMQYQLNNPVINGKHFFYFVNHYYELSQKVIEADKRLDLNSRASGILKKINDYEGNYRTGDKYVRTLFNCALMCYLDKFGDGDKEALSRVIEHIFIWSYRLRLKQKAVYWASVDKHVLNNNLFKVMQKAVKPTDITSQKMQMMKGDVKSSKTAAIKKEFERLHYIDSDGK